MNNSATGGTWQVYADVSKDNDGLAGYDIDVLSGGDARVTGTTSTGIVLKAPRPTDNGAVNDGGVQYRDGSGGVMGFNSSTNTNGTVSGGNRIGMIGAQSTTYVGNDDPTYDMGVLVGVGQEDSSASPQNGSQGPINGSGFPVAGVPNPVWTYQPPEIVDDGFGNSDFVTGTLIEQGTYSILPSPFTGSLSVQLDPAGSVTVLTTGGNIPSGGLNFPGVYPSGDNQLWGKDPYQAEDISAATVSGSTIDVVYIPEPKALSLIALMGVGLLGASRPLRLRKPLFALL